MATVGVFDSGSGGLSVLREIRKLLPDDRFVYYSDNASCPYGDKSPEFVTARSRDITEFLISRGAQAVVVACNTATAAAIGTLRSLYDIPFIGMEPAIKPAVSASRSGVVGVLATAGTLKASKYLDTKRRCGTSVRIVEGVGRGFVELVESLELDGPRAESIVREAVGPMLSAGADIIVLGCTHYPFLLPLLRRIAPPEVSFYDPAPAVARRLREVLQERGISLGEPHPHTELHASGPDDTLKKLFSII